MRFIITIMLITVASSLFAQKQDKRVGKYTASLSEVERPKKVEQFTVDTLTQTYEDNNLKIVWTYSSSQLGFELTNKLDKTMKVIWDESAFITMVNETEKVFHKGVKYIERENSQPPTSIYKGTTLSDLVSPTSYTSYVSGQYGGWRSKRLIPITQSVWSKKIPYNEALLGKTMRVVLAIKADDETMEYVFSFKTKFIEEK